MSLISTLPYVGYKNVYVAIGSGKWGQLPEGFLFRKFPTLSKKKKKKLYKGDKNVGAIGFKLICWLG